MNVLDQLITDQFAAYHGDACEVLPAVTPRSVRLSVFSPPFGHSLYVYSNSPRDIANSRSAPQFEDHFRFVADALLKAATPAGLCAAHVMNVPLMKERDGVIGLRDFRGETVRLFQSVGWTFHSEVCIWKDPVTQMQRTKALGLLHKTVRENASMSRQGLPDYLVVFRAPGEPAPRVTHDPAAYPVDLWQRVASPVWMDIDPSDTLQRESARDEKDERHIAPLQLEVIRRCVELWTNPGDVVLSPFMGIGSEGHVALGGATRAGHRLEPRRFIGVELKDSYYRQAVANLRAAASPAKQASLFDALAPVAEASSEEPAEAAPKPSTARARKPRTKVA